VASEVLVGKPSRRQVDSDGIVRDVGKTAVIVLDEGMSNEENMTCWVYWDAGMVISVIADGSRLEVEKERVRKKQDLEMETNVRMVFVADMV